MHSFYHTKIQEKKKIKNVDDITIYSRGLQGILVNTEDANYYLS